MRELHFSTATKGKRLQWRDFCQAAQKVLACLTFTCSVLSSMHAFRVGRDHLLGRVMAICMVIRYTLLVTYSITSGCSNKKSYFFCSHDPVPIITSSCAMYFNKFPLLFFLSAFITEGIDCCKILEEDILPFLTGEWRLLRSIVAHVCDSTVLRTADYILGWLLYNYALILLFLHNFWRIFIVLVIVWTVALLMDLGNLAASRLAKTFSK